MPKVSIVVPVYNVEQYLQQCLDSLANQTLRDIEVICVNDGSTDNCKEILDNQVKKDSRFKVIHKQNSGYGNTVNIGIENVTGKYVGIVESDDFINESMYEELYNTALKTSGEVIRSAHNRIYEYDKNQVYIAPYNIINSSMQENECLSTDKCDTKALIKFFSEKCTWVGLYSLEFLNKYNIRHNETEGASFQDTGFLFKVFMYARTIGFLNKPFYYYRIDNPNSSMKSKSKLNAINNEYRFMNQILDEISVKRSDVKKYYYKEWFIESMNQILRVSEELVEDMIEVIKEFMVENEQEFTQNDSELGIGDKEFIRCILEDKQLLVNKVKSFKVNRKIMIDRINNIFKDKEIYIYGVTQLALTVINLLDELHLSYKVKGFVVTDINTSTIAIKHRGIPVIEYHSLVDYDNLSMIVATQREKSEMEISNNLKSIGINNYIKYSDIVEKITIGGLLNQFDLYKKLD